MRGYSFVELIFTVLILSVLTSMSLAAITGTAGLVEKEQAVSSVAGSLRLAESQALYQGRAIPVDFARSALWVDDTKVLTLPDNWAFGREVSKLTVLSTGALKITGEDGEARVPPQSLPLTYNQKQVAFILMEPRALKVVHHHGRTP